MIFSNLKLNEIEIVLKYKPDILYWQAKDRKTHIIGIQLTGNYRHDISGKNLYLSENSVFFLNRKDDYDVECLEKGESFSVHFTTFGDIDTDSFCVKINDSAKFINLLNELENAYLSGKSDSVFAVSSFYSLCGFTDLAANKPIVHDKEMEMAKKYIDLHFSDKDCIDKACEIRRVTKRRFNDLFLLNYNTTPNRYLTEIKISHSKELLKISGISVGSVAEMCGFSDIYYFSKKFKEKCGISPSEYRNLK